jgi:hypothetical protein
MTDRIDELQRLHEAATKGPWRPQADDEHDIEADAGEVVGNYDWEEGGCIHRSDRDLIVAMRNALPALLRVARAARRCLDGSEVDGWHTPMREVDVAELREALGELEREA